VARTHVVSVVRSLSFKTMEVARRLMSAEFTIER